MCTGWTGGRGPPRQDVGCAINELLEIAVRALSPGINDPFTAMACIDYLGRSLSRLATRQYPSPVRLDDDGRARIIAKPSKFGESLDSAFDQIRHYGRDSATVTLRIMDALAMIARGIRRDADRQELLRQAETTQRSSETHLSNPDKRSEVRQRFDAICQMLQITPAAIGQPAQNAPVTAPHD